MELFVLLVIAIARAPLSPLPADADCWDHVVTNRTCVMLEDAESCGISAGGITPLPAVRFPAIKQRSRSHEHLIAGSYAVPRWRATNCFMPSRVSALQLLVPHERLLVLGANQHIGTEQGFWTA